MNDPVVHGAEDVLNGKEPVLNRMRAAGSSAIKEVEREVEVLNEKFEMLSKDVVQRLKRLDGHMHENPYRYLMGVGLVSLGIGYLIKTSLGRKA